LYDDYVMECTATFPAHAPRSVLFIYCKPSNFPTFSFNFHDNKKHDTRREKRKEEAPVPLGKDLQLQCIYRPAALKKAASHSL